MNDMELAISDCLKDGRDFVFIGTLSAAMLRLSFCADKALLSMSAFLKVTECEKTPN